MTFAIGESVGAYRVTDRLGQGGMATVYRAYHAKLNRYVAIKVMHPAFKEDTDFLTRFQREAQIVAALEHPNIVPVYDYNEHNGQPYLVMKFIEGSTLKARATEKPMTIDGVVRIITSVGYALTYAHNMGILHRDIKPSNILLENNSDHPYLADFGLARIAGAGESTMSQDMMLGTPQYMSPEQAQGIRDLDAGTDIYSLGVIIYEMLVGRVPFNADTPYAIVHDHIYTPLPLPSKINPQIPRGVEEVLLKGLAKDRTDRYQSAAEMVDAFRNAVEHSDLVASKFTVGNYRVAAAGQPANKPAIVAPNTISTPTNLSGMAITGPANDSVTPKLPPLPSSATAILLDKTPTTTTPLPIGVPGVLSSSLAAAANLTLPESLAELRRRQHRRQRQSQLWMFGGFAGLVVTLLTGLLVAAVTLTDPSLRNPLFNSAAVFQLTSPAPRPESPQTKPVVTAKPTSSTATTAATSAATSSVALNPTVAPSRTPGSALNATNMPDVPIPDLTEAAALLLTQQDDKAAVNWFALALAELRGRKLLPGINNNTRIQTAFENGYSLAVNNSPLLFSAAKSFAGSRAPVYATYLFAKVLMIPTLSTDDRNLSIHYVYMTARGASTAEQALFTKLTADFPQLIEAFAFASIAASNIDHFAEADAYLSKTVSLNPTSWETHLARGMLEAAHDQPDLAIGEFRAVQASSNAPAWMMQEITNLINQAAATLTATAGSTASPTPTPAASATP